MSGAGEEEVEEEEVEEGGEGGKSLAVQVQPSWKESRQRRWRE